MNCFRNNRGNDMNTLEGSGNTQQQILMFPQPDPCAVNMYVNDEGIIAEKKRLKSLSIYHGVVCSARKNHNSVDRK